MVLWSESHSTHPSITCFFQNSPFTHNGSPFLHTAGGTPCIAHGWDTVGFNLTVNTSNCSMQHSLPPKKQNTNILTRAGSPHDLHPGNWRSCPLYYFCALTYISAQLCLSSIPATIWSLMCSVPKGFVSYCFLLPQTEMCCWQRIKQRYCVHAKHQIKNIPVITCPVAFTMMSFGYYYQVFFASLILKSAL